MTRIAICILAYLLLAAGPASAQREPFNAAGVTMGHWHLNSQNVATNKALFIALGGKAIKPGDFEIVNFPGVSVFLHQRPGAPAPTGGTAGTVINHVGLIVPNVQESFAKWKAANLPIEMGKDRTDQAWITTVDGLRVEILEDKSQTVPIKHHHVHFHLADQAIPAIQAWYAKHFGARPGMRGQNQAADIPGVNLTFSATDMSTVTTKGRVLDHIGLDVRALAAFVKKLEAAGVKIDRPFTPNDQGGGLAFVYDPWGTYIELNQRPNPVYVTQ